MKGIGLQSTGARPAPAPELRNRVGRWAAGRTIVFCLPGIDALARRGWLPHGAGIEVAATPAHANVLLLAGPLPAPLARAAAVTFAQMPRPRALVQFGAASCPDLPKPDLVLDDAAADLPLALAGLPRDGWREEVTPFQPAFLREACEPESEEADGHEEQHHGDDHGHDGHEDDGDGDGDDGDGDGDDHFMSMVEMTRDMPRSADGLAMERNPAQFGPFFPGLPGGNVIELMLDGDSVHHATWQGGNPQAALDVLGLATPRDLLHALENRFPATPQQWRALTVDAVGRATGRASDPSWRLDAVPVLEHERIRSHLAWLLVFAETVGSTTLRRAATDVLASDPTHLAKTDAGAKLLALARQQLFLARRLRRIGCPPSDHAWPHGPLARAAGRPLDARRDDPVYRSLDFAPLALEEDNAWGRLELRLREISQSLELSARARRAGGQGRISTDPLEVAPPPGELLGSATLESPQGPSTLTVRFSAGRLQLAKLTAPSAPAMQAVPDLTRDRELADALIAVASLDISTTECPLRFNGDDSASNGQPQAHQH